MKNSKLINKFKHKYNKTDYKDVIELSFKKYKNYIENWNKTQNDFELKNETVHKLATGWKTDLLTSEITQKKSTKNIVFLGESLCRCYGFDPFLNFKTLFNNVDNQGVIDLARTSMPTLDVLNYIEVTKEIQPNDVVIMIGNNYPRFLFLNSYMLEVLAEEGIDPYKYVEELYFENIFLPLVKKINNLLKLDKKNIHFVVPVANIFSWESTVKKLDVKGEKLGRVDYIYSKELMSQNLDFEFAPDLNGIAPGIGLVARSAFLRALKGEGNSHVDSIEFINQKEDFIDYCHLSLNGIEKTAERLFEKLGMDLGVSIDKKTLHLKGLSSSYLIKRLYNQPVNDKYFEDKEKIDSLFNGKPLFENINYHKLLNEPHLKQILAAANPKVILKNIKIENLDNKKSDLLSSKYLNNFTEIKRHLGSNDDYYFDIYHDQIFFKFKSMQKKALTLTVGSRIKSKGLDISILLNSKKIGNLTCGRQEIPLEVISGINTIEINCKTNGIQFDVRENIKLNIENCYFPTLYGLYELCLLS